MTRKPHRAMGEGLDVASLRQAFDDVFTAPATTVKDALTVLLAIQVGGDPFALPLGEIAGLAARRTVVPIPSRVPALWGLVGLRGQVVPVFRLPALLGYSVADDALQWLIRCGAQGQVVLAFETLEETLQVPSNELHAAGDSTRPHVAAILQHQNTSRTVLSVPAIFSVIEDMTRGKTASDIGM